MFKRNRNGSGSKGISRDRLLFQCIQVAKQRSEDDQEIFWPHFSSLSEEERGEEIEEAGLDGVLEDLLSWYAANFAILQAEDLGDVRDQTELAKTLVDLGHDLDQIFGTEKVKEAKDQIFYQAKRLFPNNFGHVECFINWKFFGLQEAPQDHGGGEGAPRNSGGQQRKKGGRRNQGRGGNGHFKNGNDNRPREKDEEREKRVLHECEEAFIILKENPDREAVALNPQNSFYRRLQHQHIEENGYTSRSVGDGGERAVIVQKRGE